MRIFKGLYLASFIIAAAAAWYNVTKTDSSDPVFGVALDENGASCAVSLPSGKTRHLCFVKGNVQYTELWRKWYRVTTALVSDDHEYPWPTEGHVRAVQAEWRRILNPANMSWRSWFGQFVGRHSSNLEELFALDYYQDDEATEILSTTLQSLRESVLGVLNNTEPLQFERPYVDIALPSWLFRKLPVFSDEAIAAGAPEGHTHITSHGYRQFTSRISTAVHRAGFRQWKNEDPMEIMEHHFAGDRTGGPLAAPNMALRQVISSVGESSRAVALVKWETLENDTLISTWVEKVDSPLVGQAAWTSLLVPAGSIEDEMLTCLGTIAKTLNAAKFELDGNTSNSEEGISVLLVGSWWTTDSAAHLEKLLPSWEFKTMRNELSLAALGAAEAARDLYSSFVDTMCVFEMPDIVDEDREL